MTDTETRELEAPPVMASEPIRAMPAPARRHGWFGPILGGVIAVGAGFGLAQYVPGGWPVQDISALQAALTDWQAMAEKRQAAVAAVAGLAAAMQ